MTDHDYLSSFRSISPDEFKEIGFKLFANECASKKEYLVWWSPKEDFANFGIGHFIWLKAGSRLPFSEQLPELIAFYLEKRVEVPEFILRNKFTGCPWQNKQEMDNDPRKPDIIEWLYSTMSVQAAFIIFKAMDSLKEIVRQDQPVSRKLLELSKSIGGRFAVVDYLNFKGTGLDLSERINGEGWGLIQVLEKMRCSDIESFVLSAAEVLTKRVNNYNDERNDLSFLDGWMKRVEGYRTK